MAKFAVILLAAGKSSRFRDKEKKVFADLDGRAAWLRSLEIFSVRDDVAQIIVVIAPEDKDLFDRRYRANVAFLSIAKVVFGGAERYDSVEKALVHVTPEAEFVAIHDAARPCLTREMVDLVFERAAKTGAAVLGVPIADSLKLAAKDGTIAETVDRAGLWSVQTPQVFRRQIILDAYANRVKAGTNVTDDCRLVEAMGVKVSLVEGDGTNIKITSKKDLALAAAIIKSRPKPKGEGFIHPFADDDMWR